MPLSVAIALAMALWVNGKIRGRAALRLAFFIPTVLPMVAAANIWLFFYTPDYGLLNQIGRAFGFASVNWLGDPASALPALMAVTIWKEAGFFMIFFLAALQQVRPDLYEAARMENASALAGVLAHHLAAGDADHAVRRHQRADQRVPRRRPGHRHDRRRAEQRDDVAAVLHLSGRLQLLGFRLRRRVVDGAAVRARRASRSRSSSCSTAGFITDERGSRKIRLADRWPPGCSGCCGRCRCSTRCGPASIRSAYATRFDLASPLTLHNFARAWEAAPFARYFANTLVLVLGIMAGQFVICTLAAFGLARWKFYGSEVLFALILVQLMVTPDVLILENYRTLQKLGLIDTLTGIGLPYVASAFGIFLLRQAFKTIPRELDDAARIEGAEHAANHLARLPAAGAAGLCRLWPRLRQLSLEQFSMAADRHQLGRDAAADRRPAGVRLGRSGHRLVGDLRGRADDLGARR